MPGFGVRVRHGGKTPHRTFIAQYKISSKLGDKQRRINLGNVAKVNLDTARAEARMIFGKVAAGYDPANERAATRKAAAHTMGATIEARGQGRQGEAAKLRRNNPPPKYSLEAIAWSCA
jgi:hypothetical protein